MHSTISTFSTKHQNVFNEIFGTILTGVASSNAIDNIHTFINWQLQSSKILNKSYIYILSILLSHSLSFSFFIPF